MSTQTLKDAVRALVMREFYVVDPAALRDDQSLLLSGIMDSTGVVELVAHLGVTFGIEIRSDDISPKNLDTVDRIVAFVAARQAAGLKSAG